MKYKYDEKTLTKMTKENLIILIKKYEESIETTRKYILKNIDYQLPNKWNFKGNIEIVYDLLDLSIEYYRKK